MKWLVLLVFYSKWHILDIDLALKYIIAREKNLYIFNKYYINYSFSMCVSMHVCVCGVQVCTCEVHVRNNNLSSSSLLKARYLNQTQSLQI